MNGKVTFNPLERIMSGFNSFKNYSSSTTNTQKNINPHYESDWQRWVREAAAGESHNIGGFNVARNQ